MLSIVNVVFVNKVKHFNCLSGQFLFLTLKMEVFMPLGVHMMV